MSEQVTLLRVFVASPGDVKEERESITKVVNELNNIFDKDNIFLKVVKWETDVSPGAGEESQAVIDKQIGDNYDIFVGIMWTRFGTPTRHAGSGTVHEFNKAYERYQKNPDSLQIMFYFNQKQPNLDDIDTEQLNSLREFKSKLGGKGVLYWNYNGIDNFEPQFRAHLADKIQNWGKTWGTCTGGIETIDSDKEVDEIKEMNEIVDEGEEYGFIEYIEIGTDNFETSAEAINRISSATVTVGEKVSENAEEYKQSQIPTPNMKQGKMILKRTADDMEQFVKRVKPEIPIFSDAFSIGMDAYTRAAALLNDFEGENEDQILNALTTIKEMRSSMLPALGGIQNLRDATHKIPRMSRDIIMAKKHMVAILDDLINEINSSKDLTAEAEKTLEKVLIDYQNQRGLQL